jgi:hypothetical protein
MTFPPPIEPSLPFLPLDRREWEWKAFERFCLDVVNALPDVRYADFYGTQGDKQDGIDILAELTNGDQRTYQCKKYASFGPKRAETAVKDNVYKGAAEHVLLVACMTSVKTQKYMGAQPDWRLLDMEGISSVVRTQLGREAARRIVEDHFGVPIRRAFLGAGSTVFIEPARYFSPFEHGGLFRHTWALVGRKEIVEAISVQLAAKRVVVLPGRGGIGKTRLLRELAERDAEGRVLFAVDDVTITPESVEDLPSVAFTVVVDDVHRRDDLAPLLAGLVRRDRGEKLILSTRPQRLDELRGQLARSGYRGTDIFVADPLDDLPQDSSEELAREALGPQHAHHAEALAAATSDCPLVTVVGGQLLASRAVDPQLLERQQDFRDEVLSRWQDEIIGQLRGGLDAAAAAGALRLVAALAPLSVADGGAVALVADELTLELPALLQLLGELEQAGLLLARGRLRRIIPDVLADHILHKACLDQQDRPTGYADQLVDRYAATSLTPLLRNLAELDWRIGQTAGASTLLEEVWDNLTNAFAAASASGRLEILSRIRPTAVFAPRQVLRIIELALREPATPAAEFLGATDARVRDALPGLLARVGQHADLAPAVLAQLWQLGRDEPGPLHSHPEHAIRLAQELGGYALTPAHTDATLKLVEQLIADGEGDAHLWSPLELLRPLVARTVDQTRMVGFAMQLGSLYVIAERATAFRERVFALISEEARKGSDRTQYLAADLLGDALQTPYPVGGGAAPEDQIEQWHDEELRLVELAADLVRVGPPLLRMALRKRLSWLIPEDMTTSSWPDVVRAASEAVSSPVTDEEQMITVFAYPQDLAADWEQSHVKAREFGAALASSPDADDTLAEKLNAAVERLDVVGQFANPTLPLDDMATRNPQRGAAIAEWLVEHPDEPLARFAGTLLAPLRASEPAQLNELLDRFDSDDVRLRRQLATYLQAGSWFDDPQPADLERMRRLLNDEDPGIRGTVIHALLPLTNVDRALAVELALEADTSDGRHASLIDHVLAEGTDTVGGTQLESRLRALEQEQSFSWSSWQLLLTLGKTQPERVLDVLVARAQSDNPHVKPVSRERGAGDVLAGYDDAQYEAALRLVREGALTTRGIVRRHLGELFWALDRDQSTSLDILGEWLIDAEVERVGAAARLLDPLPLPRRPRGQPGMATVLGSPRPS